MTTPNYIRPAAHYSVTLLGYNVFSPNVRRVRFLLPQPYAAGAGGYLRAAARRPAVRWGNPQRTGLCAV